MTGKMEIDEADARRVLRWQRAATNTTGMDGEDTALVTRIRVTFPLLVKEEQFRKAADALSIQVERDPRVMAVREKLRAISISSTKYDKGLDELMKVKAVVEKELVDKQEAKDG